MTAKLQERLHKLEEFLIPDTMAEFLVNGDNVELKEHYKVRLSEYQLERSEIIRQLDLRYASRVPEVIRFNDGVSW